MSMICVKNFPNGMYAEMAKQLLDTEGIPCVLKGAGGGLGPVVLYNAGGTWPVVGPGVDVYVPEEYAERAEELLRAIYDGM
jgi:hypothetical protein